MPLRTHPPSVDKVLKLLKIDDDIHPILGYTILEDFREAGSKYCSEHDKTAPPPIDLKTFLSKPINSDFVNSLEDRLGYNKKPIIDLREKLSESERLRNEAAKLRDEAAGLKADLTVEAQNIADAIKTSAEEQSASIIKTSLNEAEKLLTTTKDITKKQNDKLSFSINEASSFLTQAARIIDGAYEKKIIDRATDSQQVFTHSVQGKTFEFTREDAEKFSDMLSIIVSGRWPAQALKLEGVSASQFSIVLDFHQGVLPADNRLQIASEAGKALACEALENYCSQRQALLDFSETTTLLARKISSNDKLFSHLFIKRPWSFSQDDTGQQVRETLRPLAKEHMKSVNRQWKTLSESLKKLLNENLLGCQEISDKYDHFIKAIQELSISRAANFENRSTSRPYNDTDHYKSYQTEKRDFLGYLKEHSQSIKQLKHQLPCNEDR